MNPYSEAIAKEEAKLELLLKKVEICKQVIAALRGADSDDIDAAISKQIGQSAPPSAIQKPASKGGIPVISGLRTRSDSVAPFILQYIGEEGKTLDEIASHLKSIEKSTTRGTLRTLLMNLRVRHGFIENPNTGFYKLSEKGLKAVSGI